MRFLLVCIAVLARSAAAFAQGAILETPDDLRAAPSPEGFRGQIPARVDLSPKMPPPRSQGLTSTCVSWGATYAAASLALRARGFSSELTLSPSFTYNQISRDEWCATGTKISATLDLLRDSGALPIGEFAFDGAWCGRLPTKSELERAREFRIKSWTAFDASSLDRVKEQLARGVPVIFNISTPTKLSSLQGDAVLTDDGVQGQGHTMVVVGYDDAKGAFLIQNSSGQSWASKGYGWFGYEFFRRNVGPGFVIE